MRRADSLSLLVVAFVVAGSGSVRAEDGFRPLFNGKDLAGWVPVNVAPETFTARDGMIVSTGKPTGVLRTDRQYENFVMELEWRHMQPGGNAGLWYYQADNIGSVRDMLRPIRRGLRCWTAAARWGLSPSGV